MNSTTYTAARKNLKNIFDESSQDSKPMIITRRNGEDMVILPLSYFESLDETAYLLKSSKNRNVLKKSIQELENNEIIEFDPTLS